MNEWVLIVGATSGIGRALCGVMAARGCHLVLAGRDASELAKLAIDLRKQHRVEAMVEAFEATDFDGHADFFNRCVAVAGELDGIVVCVGELKPQSLLDRDFAQARRTIDVNLTGVASVLALAANYFERRRRGYIAAISSVAGERGRASNYTYGAAKAGLTVFLQGLRSRLHPAGVRVIAILPGYVATRMTEGILNPKSPLVASPHRVAMRIDRAIRKKRDVAYAPGFWRIVMGVIRLLPESIGKRLKW